MYWQKCLITFIFCPFIHLPFEDFLHQLRESIWYRTIEYICSVNQNHLKAACNYIGLYFHCKLITDNRRAQWKDASVSYRLRSFPLCYFPFLKKLYLKKIHMIYLTAQSYYQINKRQISSLHLWPRRCEKFTFSLNLQTNWKETDCVEWNDHKMLLCSSFPFLLFCHKDRKHPDVCTELAYFPTLSSD